MPSPECLNANRQSALFVSTNLIQQESMDPTTVDVDFADTKAVKKRLRLLRAKGQYDAGHEFIIALPEWIRKMKAVAIEAAQLYLVQGHYIRAARVCAGAAEPFFRD